MNIFSKILAIFPTERASDPSVPIPTGGTPGGTSLSGEVAADAGKSNAYNIFISDDGSYNALLAKRNMYKDCSGGDLTLVFCPFELVHKDVTLDELSSMPSSEEAENINGANSYTNGITFGSLNPFYMDGTNQNIASLEDASKEGSHSDVVTGEFYTTNTKYVRNPSDVRGIALRGPVMIAGWGYDTNGKPVPYPTDESGEPITDAETPSFKGGDEQETVDFGYQVNPRHYCVGPLDVRWDNKRKVWAGSGVSTSFWATINSSTLVAPNRWQYSISPSDPATAGAFVLKPDGVAVIGYNSIESGNTETGMLGIGETGQSIIDKGGELLAIGNGASVYVHALDDCAIDGATVYIFSCQNQVAYSCETE